MKSVSLLAITLWGCTCITPSHSCSDLSPSFSGRDHRISWLCGDKPDQRCGQHAEDTRSHPHHYHRHVSPGGLPGGHLWRSPVLCLLTRGHVGQELVSSGELQLWAGRWYQVQEGQTQCTELVLRGLIWAWVHSLDYVACTAQRPRTRLAASISSGASAIRQAKRTANPIDPHEGRVQESTGGLDWSTLFSGAAVKKKQKKLQLPVGGTVYKRKQKYVQMI